MGILGKAENLIGLGLVAGALFLVTRYGKAAGAGMTALSKGVSSLLSPKIRPTFKPTVGFKTELPQLKLFGFPLTQRGEDRGQEGPPPTGSGAGYGNGNGTRDEDRDNGYWGAYGRPGAGVA